MKLFFIVFAVIAAVAADVSHLPSNDYLPPVQEAVQLPSNDYLPPVQQAAPAPIQYAAPVQHAPEPEPAHEVAEDGYRYKTHRRVVYRRHRRDVSHLPSNEYLPPVQEQAAPVEEVHYEAPVAQVEVQQYSAPVEAEPAHELADDGYRYKTHRRVVYRRHRRDVSHLPSNEYLPPVQEQAAPVEEVHYEAPVAQVEVQQYSAPVEAEPAHELADDGYRYKTHRRVVYRRHRRDVSHLPSNEYLPPVQEAVEVPSNDYLPPVQQAAPAPIQHSAPVQYAPEPEPAHELADDGYRYKTHRRVVYRRHRRDVSHLPSNEYLPPVQEQAAPVEEVHYEAPVAQVEVQQYSAPVEAEPAHELADDGYRYKTHRRVVYRRHRRNVGHSPSNEYLPPVQEQAAPVEEVHYEAPVAQVEVQQYSAPVEAEPAHELAQDGYRYKTHRRVVYRRH